MTPACKVCDLAPQIEEYGTVLFHLIKSLVSAALLVGLIASLAALLVVLAIMLIARRVNL